MRVNSRTTVQAGVVDDDAGEGLAIFFSQNGNSVARYRFIVYANINQGVLCMGDFYSSPPLSTPSLPGRQTRMLAAAVCPGATGWTVEVSGVPIDLGEGLEIPEDTADIILASSRCCTSPVGVTRVGERYNYRANDATGVSENFILLPGQRATGIAVIGSAGGGTVQIGSGGDVIVVPDGISMNLEPGSLLDPNQLIIFGNVNWVIEYLESA